MRIVTNSISRWREEICRHLLAVDFEAAPHSQFRGSVAAALDTNGVRVTRIGHTPGLTSRDRVLAKDGTDSVALLLVPHGAVHVSHSGREARLRPGQTTLLRTWEPGKVALSREVDYTAVLIPNAAFDRSDRIDALAGTRLPGTSALSLITLYASSLLAGHDPLDGEFARLASAHLVELAQLAVDAGAERIGETESESIAEARLRVALELIATRHREPDLSVNDIAAAQGITARYLQKLLEGKGISFSHHLNFLRLQTARAILTRPDVDYGRITDIAMSCGFRDLSYFNRLFRRLFGDTPTGLRADRHKP